MKRQQPQMQSVSGKCGPPSLYRQHQNGAVMPAGKERESVPADWTEQKGCSVDRELASMGYSVRSEQLLQVAHKLEQLEMMCGSQQEGVAHLASDAIHYNPSDLAGWVENMLAELNPPPSCMPADLTPPVGMQNAYDLGALYEAGMGLDGSGFLYTGCAPSGGSMMPGPQELLAAASPLPSDSHPPSSTMMMHSLIQTSFKGNPKSATPVEDNKQTNTPAVQQLKRGEADRPMVLAATDDPQETGIRLVHTLMACAEAIQQEKRARAGNMVKEIKALASMQGGAMSKVACHFAEGLARRIWGFPTNDIFLMRNDALSKILHLYFYETCPYLKFAHFTANQAILEAFAGHGKVHVIDFDLKEGMQWPALLQALGLRAGGPPMVRLTGVGPSPTGSLQEVGAKLTEFARTLNVDFHFQCCEVGSLNELKPWLLNISVGEAVAVNSIMQLHRLLAVSGGLEEVLGMVCTLKPKILTLVEEEANHNKPVFLERFTEALHYYSTVFDSLEAAAFPAISEAEVMSEIYLGREICNIVACEGLERVVRHEPLMLWRLRMYNAGFRAVHLGSNAFKQVSMLLHLYSDGFRIEENNGCLTLGWHSRPLIFASAWQCR